MNKSEVLNEDQKRTYAKGEAELGRLDISTCEESVKKSFHTFHAIDLFPEETVRSNPFDISARKTARRSAGMLDRLN